MCEQARRLQRGWREAQQNLERARVPEAEACERDAAEAFRAHRNAAPKVACG